MILAVKDWHKHFENNRTKGMKMMQWIPITNKMDGLGYLTLVDHPDGARHFAAWCAIVQIASRQKVRGTLPQLRAGILHPPAGIPQALAGIPQALAVISRLPAEIFEAAIPRLIDIGWIEQLTGDCGEPAPIPHIPAGIRHLPARKGREEKEGKGVEGNTAATASVGSEEGDGDLSDKIHEIVEKLFVAHAAVGLVPGNHLDAEHAVAEILDGAVSPENILASLMPAHAAHAPHWRERLRSGTLKAHMLPVAHFIRDGDYQYPPAAIEPVKPSASREYQIPWKKPQDAPEEVAV